MVLYSCGCCRGIAIPVEHSAEGGVNLLLRCCQTDVRSGQSDVHVPALASPQACSPTLSARVSAASLFAGSGKTNCEMLGSPFETRRRGAAMIADDY